ncbi:MAG TPA: GNAT family N-acetyltransferase [Candidatus Thermoplasmatota archaeon]|nr:GNAT family N-acetyltransferase [Candidatus Thermoplasmatota archaeon]
MTGLRVEEGDTAEWARLASQDPAATFFQQPAWYEASRALAKDRTLAVTRLSWPDGNDAMLPLWTRKAGVLGRRWDALGNAAGLYGGWVSARPLSAPQVAEVAAWLRARCRSLALRINPFQDVPPAAAQAIGPVEEEDTFLVDLAGGPQDIVDRYAKGQRENVNKARRHGITCRLARGPEDWQAYVAMYEETLRRWGPGATSRYKPDQLLAFQSLPTENCQLWIAETSEGEMAAAALHFSHGPHILGWHLANRTDLMRLFPTKLLIHEVILDAQRRGLRWYDLNVSGGHEGPQRWKQMMGAQPRPAPFIRIETAQQREARLAKRARQAAAQAAEAAAASAPDAERPVARP